MAILQKLVRANSLLLQGAYQGAEHILDSAIVDVRELVAKADNAEQLQIRVGEMAAEIERLSYERQCLAEAIGSIAIASGDTRTEFTGPDLLMVCGDAAEGINHLTAENARLQSIIDEANAQEPTASRRKDFMGNYVYRDESILGNEPLYARPIPAQPVIETFDNFLIDMADQQKNSWLSVCKLLDDVRPEWITRGKTGTDCALDTIREMATQQSPAVAVPDEAPYVFFKKIKGKDEWSSWNEFSDGSAGGKPLYEHPSPRITEQDAREIINSAVGFMYEEPSYPCIDYWLHEEGRALLNKLSAKPEIKGGAT